MFQTLYNWQKLMVQRQCALQGRGYRKRVPIGRYFQDGPTLLEFIIPTELNVLPMVPAGKSLSDMLLKDKNRRGYGINMEKRCISAYVENQIGVLAKISGLFAGKNYNLDTLTVGETEDPTMSRMTIELTCDDLTYEQIIKQLNRV